MRSSTTTGDELAIPRAPRVVLPRPRLRRTLDHACQGAVTLLVAPVGAGKTVGVADWLRDDDGQAPHLADWITGRADLGADHLAAILDAAAPAGPEDRPHLVVVDDAHRLPPESIQLVDDWLNGRPADLRLLLLSREDLPLTRLVPELLGNFTALRGDCLRLTRTESAELISRISGSSSRDVLAAVAEQADGWCAAAVLAARTVGASSDLDAAVERLRDSFVSIAALMADEVFDALTPRQRHLALCLSGEETIDAPTAALLSRDDQAARLLAELESTGLLITRLPGTGAVGPTNDGTTPPDVSGHTEKRSHDNHARFRIHPLVDRICRQRLADHGVEAARARATVTRAVRLDLARGQLTGSFSRLVRVGAATEAADVLAHHGIRLVLDNDPNDQIGQFLHDHPDAVDAHPGTWFPMALRCWLGDDTDGVRHWSTRILDSTTNERLPLPETADDHDLRIACLRLWRAALGLEPVHAALGDATRVLDAAHHDDARLDDADILPLLAGEIGVAQNWVGDLPHAEESLSRATHLAHGRGLHTAAAISLSHLALNQYMRGRERTCADLATETLTMLDLYGTPRRFAAARAGLARFLALLTDVPSRTDGETVAPGPHDPTDAHSADHCAHFWFQIRDARRAALEGDMARVQHLLDTARETTGTAAPRLPDHLLVVLLMERALLAALTTDTAALASLGAELTEIGAVGEAALVDGLRADRSGDRHRAAAAFDAAAEDAVYSQPPTHALALTWGAQILDALGSDEAARDALTEALAATETRGNAMPFLGWLRQGTPLHTLLTRHATRTNSIWARELLHADRGRPHLATHVAAVAVTPAERERVPTGIIPPHLSGRETEVLGQLARGATYADIASSLFVSENTVKTHVSSLYAKLGASRRSEALATARSLRLL